MKANNKNTTRKKLKTFQICFFGIFALLILIRLWLVNTTNWYVNGDTYYDSRLELNTAITIAAGKWAGVYSKFILCKNLAFPLFLAVMYLTRISYPIAMFFVIAFASFLFARSLKPIVKNDYVRKIIFLIVLYNPVGFGGEFTYHYRNAIVPWVVLSIIACLSAIYLRRQAELKKLLPWATASLVLTGFFWNLREDSIWFLPFIVGGYSAIILHYFFEIRQKSRSKRPETKRSIKFALLALCPIFSIFLWNTTISTINYFTYGIYATNDRTATYSAKVLGQLILIDDGADLKEDLWVSSEALELAKQTSPTFATLNLQPFDNWSKVGDFSIWALRDSAEASGYYQDAVSTNKMFKTVYEELRAGFTSGALKKKQGFQLSDTSGFYSGAEMVYPLKTGLKSIINHVTYSEYRVVPENTINVSEADLLLYENTLGIHLLRSNEHLAELNADARTVQSNNNLNRTLKLNRHFSNLILNIMNVVSWILFIFAIIGIVVLVIKLFKHKDFSNYNLESLILLVGFILLSFFYSYLVGLWGLGYDLTADSTLFKSYTTAISLIITCFEILGSYHAFISIKQKMTERKNAKRKASK